MLVALAILVPGLLFGYRLLQNRTAGIEATVNRLADTAAAIAEDLDEKVQGTAQLLYGLSRAHDLDTQDKAACSRFLSAVREEYPQYTGILTINPDGRLFCDSLNTGRQLDLNDRAYVKQARDMTGGVALEPTFGRLTNLAVLQIAQPARSEAGDLRFILLASLNLTKFADAHLRRPGAMEILIVDKAGVVLAWLPQGQHHMVAGGSIAETALFRAAAATTGAGVIEVAGPDGEDQVWAVATTSPTVAQTGLKIMAGLHRRDLVAAENRRLLEGGATLALVSVLLFVGVWIVAELSLRRQIGRIGAVANRLAAGDLGARIEPPHPRGEIGALMAQLNRTAESLEQQRAAIEDLNLRLRQSQKMEAVGQLTGGIAHDFNNLLTVILGNADLLRDSLKHDRDLHGIADLTLRAAERGAELTNRLLAFGRRQALDPAPTDINKLIAAMEKLLRRTLGEHVEIEMVQSGGLWKAMVDSGQLESAILNLCLNARDAMGIGGRLTIETANTRLDAAYAAGQPELEPGQYVMVAVSDTGAGMDAQTLERAFEPFFTTKDVGKGSGLGLSMVYGFVKQSKGHVRIYSEQGQGTTVKLYLPRAYGDRAEEDEAVGGAARNGHEKILLVEDDDLVRSHVSAQLAGLGYEVVAVENGPDALDALRRDVGIDLLFTDIVMPGGINGRQLADEAKKLRPSMPVLFTSGYTENAIVHHGRLDPGVHLLQKPYRRQELAAKIREVLDRPLD